MFVENNPLLLKPDVAGPFDKEGEVLFELDVLLDAKFLGHFLKQRTDHLLGLILLYSGDWGHFLPLCLLSFRYLGWLEERERAKNKKIS